MHWLDHAVVAAYLAFTVALGIRFGRQKSREEFFAAGRSMGVLTVGLSVMATLFSSNSFVFYPSAAYEGTLRIGLSLLAFTLIAPIVMWVFVPVYARCGCRTAYEYLEQRFHVSVRCLASGLFILLRIGWLASATFAASVVLSRVSGLDQTFVIVSLGTVAILYTMLGGLRAVMWTDVVQFGVFATVIVLALWLLGSRIEGGIGGALTTYFANRDGVLVDFTPSMTLRYGSWAILIGVFLEALSAFGADQVAVQRYIAARDERVSQIGFLVNLASIWLVIPSLLLIGVGLYAHYDRHPEEMIPVLADAVPDREAEFREHPETVAAAVREAGLQDQGLPQFVRLHFPPGVTGLFLAALMAAAMSSIDSGIHSVTTALVVDFRDRLAPHWRPESEAGDVWLVRGLLVLVGAVAVTLACFVGELGDVFDVGKKTTSAFGGPLLAVFVLALFSKRMGTPAVFIATLASAGITLWLIYARSDWFSVWFWPIGFGLTLALAGILNPVLPSERSNGDETALTFWAVRARAAHPREEG